MWNSAARLRCDGKSHAFRPKLPISTEDFLNLMSQNSPSSQIPLPSPLTPSLPPPPLDHPSPDPLSGKCKNEKDTCQRHGQVGRLWMARIDPSRQVSIVAHPRKMSACAKDQRKDLIQNIGNHTFPYTRTHAHAHAHTHYRFYIKSTRSLRVCRVDYD